MAIVIATVLVDVSPGRDAARGNLTGGTDDSGRAYAIGDRRV